jgi:hypothetical protein
MGGKRKVKTADHVIWHDDHSITRFLEAGHSVREIMVLASKEPWKEMELESLRESHEEIQRNLLHFLGKVVGERHAMSVTIALEGPSSGDEVDDHDDEDEDDEDEDDEDEDDEDEDDEDEDDEGEDDEGEEVNLPASQPNKSGQAVESVAEPLEPDVTTSSLEQIEMEGLTFDEASCQDRHLIQEIVSRRRRCCRSESPIPRMDSGHHEIIQ